MSSKSRQDSSAWTYALPISLAGLNGCLHTGNKSLLLDMLIKDVSNHTQITLSGTSCLVIYGQALVMALKNPRCVHKVIFDMVKSFVRIDESWQVTERLQVGNQIETNTWKQAHKRNRMQINPSTRQNGLTLFYYERTKQIWQSSFPRSLWQVYPPMHRKHK